MPRGKHTTHSSTAFGAIEDGMTELNDLKEEMDEWRDNLDGNNMSHLPKYEEVSEACDMLEAAAYADFTSLEDLLSKEDMAIECTYKTFSPYGKNRGPSRADRCANACGMIRAGMDAFESRFEDKMSEDEIGKLQDALSEFENALNEAEGVSFPGMYS